MSRFPPPAAAARRLSQPQFLPASAYLCGPSPCPRSSQPWLPTVAVASVPGSRVDTRLSQACRLLFRNCCALHRGWGTRVSGGQGEGPVDRSIPPSHASRPCRPPLSAEPALHLGASLAAVSRQLARLPTRQGWALLGLDVLAADPACAPCAATPLRLLREDGKPSEGKTSIVENQRQAEKASDKVMSAHGVKSALLPTSCVTLDKLLNLWAARSPSEKREQ